MAAVNLAIRASEPPPRPDRVNAVTQQVETPGELAVL